MTLALAAPTATIRFYAGTAFAPGAPVVRAVEPGVTLVDAIRAHWPAGWSTDRPLDLVVLVNGYATRDLGVLVEPGDVVVVQSRVGDPVSVGALILSLAAPLTTAGTVAATIVGTIAIAGAMYGISMLLAPDAPSVQQGNNERQHFAWAGVTTEYRGYGAVMPAVFGQQIVGGTAISYVVVSRGNRSVLKLLLCLGLGPVEAIAGFARDLDHASGELFEDTDFRIGGTPVKEWGKLVRVSTRRGRVNQTAIRGMNDEERTYTVGLRLKGPAAGANVSTTNVKEFRTRTPADAVVLRIAFNEGLTWIDNDGATHQQAITFRVQYRRTELPDTEANRSGWEQFTFRGNSTGPLTRDFTLEFPSRSSYTVEVDRVTKEPATTEGMSSKSKSELSQVVEIVNRDLEYPGLALIGLEIDAVDGLSGGRPDVEVPLRGIQAMIPDEDDQDGPHTRTWTQCPFWVVYHLLRDTEYGLGGATRYMRFDVAAWRAASDHAAELVDAELETTLALAVAAGATQLRVISTAGFVADDVLKIDLGNVGVEQVEVAGVESDAILILKAPLTLAHAKAVTVTKVHARYQWDGVIDGAASPWDTIQQILATARARLVQQGNDFILVRAVARDPVMLICEGNGADDFVETRENERFQPNALDLQFWNAATRYQRDNLLVIAEDAIVDNASTATFYERETLDPKSEQVLGVCRVEQIHRHGRYRLRQIRRAGRGWACTMPLEAVVARVGDVADIAHRVVLATTWSGRVTAAAASGSSTIRLDQPVTLEAATTYAVQVRVGTVTLATRTIASPAGTYARGAALSITGTWPGDVAAGAPYALGLQGQETVAAEIVAFALQDDFRVIVATKEYVEDALADV